MSKISFVWNWDRAKYFFDLWNDGLKAALEIIARDNEIDWCLGDTTMPAEDSQFILVWSDTHSSSLERLWTFKQPKGLFLTASPVNMNNLNKFNVVFAESPFIVDELKVASTRIIHAFGTNTKLFKPMDLRKYYDAFYPATFSPWKRQELFAEVVGNKGLALGTIQPDGDGQYRSCVVSGVDTLVGYIPAELVAQLYNMSKVCVITAWHGSERTVLEAMASNIPVIVMEDNKKAVSLSDGICVSKPEVADLKTWYESIIGRPTSTRQFILDNYSEEVYAAQIMKGINGT